MEWPFSASVLSCVDCTRPLETDKRIFRKRFSISFDIMLSRCCTWHLYIVEHVEKDRQKVGEGASIAKLDLGLARVRLGSMGLSLRNVMRDSYNVTQT